MNYKSLGDTGLMVSELCLGTMTFGDRGFFKVMGGLGQQSADELVKQAVEAGINFIDTANVYAEGLSEEITGKAIRNLGLNRDDLVLATKVLGPMGVGPNDRGLSRKHIFRQVEASLKRLNTDYIDLYQIHGLDSLTPVEETIDSLNDLVISGKVRYIGASNMTAWSLMKALDYSKYNNRKKFISLQAYYSLATRDLERELVPLALDQQLGLMIYSPLSGGLLSGKYKRDAKDESTGRLSNFTSSLPINRDRAFNIIDILRPMAEIKGTTIAQLALSWLLHQQAVTCIIVGATKVSQLEDNLKSLDVKFTEDELRDLNEVSKLIPEYPGAMIASNSKIKISQ
jgi:aryl-alcohol dehydrogenase-like predicted oxidoreductase